MAVTGKTTPLLFVFFLVLLTSMNPSPASAARTAELVADAQTGHILYGENIYSLRHPASLTKIMTLYLLFSAIEQGRLSLSDRIPVSQYAANMQPSNLGLDAGDSLRVKDAILAIVTQSANDVAVAVAEYLAGSEVRFAQLMTQQARALGMKRTVYQNASGLNDDDQVTTAFDQAILARAMLFHFPKMYGYFSTPSYSYGGLTHRNHNRLMARYSGMDGIKTGYIRTSGFNLVSSARRGNKRLIGIVFGGRTARSRDNRMAEILNHGFRQVYAASASRQKFANVPVLRSGPDVADETKGNASVVASTAEPVAEGDEEPINDQGASAASNDPIAAAFTQNSSEVRTVSTPATWTVQLGTFKNRKLSKAAIASARRQAPDYLRHAVSDVSTAKKGKRTLYRARLKGLSEKAARSACDSLTDAGRSCLTLPPST